MTTAELSREAETSQNMIQSFLQICSNIVNMLSNIQSESLDDTCATLIDNIRFIGSDVTECLCSATEK
jgi:hypothetical protein